MFKAGWIKYQTLSEDDRRHPDIRDGIDWSSMTVANGNTPLQIDSIPEPMFDKVDKFFVCVTCGKVFWEGSHFAKVCDQFSHVLDMTSDGANIYNK